MICSPFRAHNPVTRTAVLITAALPVLWSQKVRLIWGKIPSCACLNVSSIKSGHFHFSPQLFSQLVLLGMSRKSGRTCAVNGCTNSSGKLQIWKQTQCEVHKPLLHDQCPCLRPYGLHRFPGRAEDQDVREKWIRNINRGDFVPNNNSTVGFGQPSRSSHND